MSVPQKTREYRLPKVRLEPSCESHHNVDIDLASQVDGFHNLTLQEAAIPKLQATEVLVKIHAVSLQVSCASQLLRISSLVLNHIVPRCSDFAAIDRDD